MPKSSELSAHACHASIYLSCIVHSVTKSSSAAVTATTHHHYYLNPYNSTNVFCVVITYRTKRQGEIYICPDIRLVYRLPISIASSTNLVLEIFHPHECVWMCLGCPPHSAGSVQRRLMLWYYIGIHSSDVASSQIHRVNFKLNSEIFHPNRLDRILFVYCGNVSSQSNWKMFVIRYYSECVEHIEMAIRPWSIKRSFSRISRYFLHVCSIQFKFVIFFVSIIEICQPTSSG